MSDVQQPVDPNSDLMKQWEAYRISSEFRNSFKWAADVQHRTGSMWAAFSEGWRLATERAASLHENINPASDDERQHKIFGAGAMGAVIEYRDKIRNDR